VIYTFYSIFKYQVRYHVFDEYKTELWGKGPQGAHQIDHTTAKPLVICDHLEALPASFLHTTQCNGVMEETEAQGGCTESAQVLWTDVLSTQSTREPDVVNGMSESMVAVTTVALEPA
jgi:hypothetical protein